MDSKHQQQQMGGDDLPSPGVQGFKDWTSKATKDTPQGGSREGHHYDDPMMSMKLNEGEMVITMGACPEMMPSMLSKAVGQAGQIIGIVPKKSPLEAVQSMLRCNLSNVRCIESNMSSIDARDNSADVVMSSVLSNQIPPREMQSVLDEMFRVLRPGGRLTMTDVMMRKEMPDNVRNMIPTSGNAMKTMVQTNMYESYLKKAGFENINIKDTRKDVNTCLMDFQRCTPSDQPNEPCGTHQGQGQGTSHKEEDKTGSYRRKVGKFTRQLVAGQEEREEDVDWNDYAGIFQIRAQKPQ